MKIQSSAFEHKGVIPKKYTCQGGDISPPLSFFQVPETAKTLALIMEDPDVPLWVRKDQLWVHWVLYNLPPDLSGIEENQKASGLLGLNTSGKAAYMGPCPPDREHRYFFKLYALDTTLNFPKSPSRDELLAAMKGHILAEAQIVGRYEKTPG